MDSQLLREFSADFQNLWLTFYLPLILAKEQRCLSDQIQKRGGESDGKKKAETGDDGLRAGYHGDAGSNLSGFGLSTMPRRVLV
jgi:hypothetical protein